MRAFASQSVWDKWLDENHRTSDGIWMQLARKASGIPSVTYAEAVESALCYGWIDGQKRPHSDTAWLQRFTPRRPKSMWSQINREKALALIEAKRMKAAGVEQVERARQDGRWDAAYGSPSALTTDADFERRSTKARARKSSSRQSARRTGMPSSGASRRPSEPKHGKAASGSTSKCWRKARRTIR